MSWAPIPEHSCQRSFSSTSRDPYTDHHSVLSSYNVSSIWTCLWPEAPAAYIYSLVSSGFLAVGMPIHKSFFETSAPLVTLIMVGCLMSVFTRRCTTSALDTVDALQVQMVNLVENDRIRSIPAKLFHVRDILQVSPDSTIPIHGVLRSGDTRVDESSFAWASLVHDNINCTN